MKETNIKLHYPNIFLCEKCKYITTYRSNFKKHFESKKHIVNIAYSAKKNKIIQRGTNVEFSIAPKLPSVAFTKIKEIYACAPSRQFCNNKLSPTPYVEKIQLLKDASANILENLKNMLNEEIGKGHLIKSV